MFKVMADVTDISWEAILEEVLDVKSRAKRFTEPDDPK